MLDKKYRSHYIKYLTWKYFPSAILVAIIFNHFEEGSNLETLISGGSIISVALLLTLEFVLFKVIKEAVVTNDGLVLNQKFSLEWNDISKINYIPLIRFYFIRYRYNGKKRFALFPTERLLHEVIFGLNDDNIVQKISLIQKKHFQRSRFSERRKKNEHNI